MALIAVPFGLFAMAALVALLGWLVGSVLARVVGALLVLDGLLSLVTGIVSPGRMLGGLAALAVGVPLWLLGHRLYLGKYGRYRSHLAARVFALRGVRVLAVRPRRVGPAMPVR